MLRLEYKPYTLEFKFKAGTSRGVMTERKVWFIKIDEEENPGCFGVGEVAPLNRLSVENIEDIEPKLEAIKLSLGQSEIPHDNEGVFELAASLSGQFQSIRFGLETALLDLINGGRQVWFEGDYTYGLRTIPINGLIWMGEKTFMTGQIDQKLKEGFQCIKMKIGAIDFDEELEVLKYLRKKSDDLVIRVDANGAFRNNEALSRLSRLSAFNIHSIEQPILPRQEEAMHLLCRKSPVPVALDEELIGIHSKTDKAELLDEIQPQYIILKPSLLGGFRETQTWIQLAESRGIGWWITSALESNLGLNAISQFTAQYPNLSFQGLGTGQLYHNNFKSKSEVAKDRMTYVDSIENELPF